MVTKEDLVEAILELKESNLRMEKFQEEMSRELKESNLRLEKSDLELKATQEEISRELKESQEKSDRRLDKMLRSHKELGKMVGGISNNQGYVAEEFFVNSLKAKPILNGIKYDFIEPNAHRSKNNIEDE